MSIYENTLSALRLQYHRRQLRRNYRTFRDFTMLPGETYVSNLMLGERVLKVPGCIVECGVWRGGMIAGLAKILGSSREYFLFDSFEGLPPAMSIDGSAAIQWQSDKESPGYHDNCSATPDFAERAMALAGVQSFRLFKGWFNETLPRFVPDEPIALLRLDSDWYDSTKTCLEVLFDRVAPDGLIILDDYHTWDGCSRALHDFLSKRVAVERIQSFDGICYIQKKGGGT